MRYIKFFIALVVVALMAACGGGGGSAGTSSSTSASTTTTVISTVKSVSIRASTNQIQADGSTVTTLIVNALDAGNGLVGEAPISMSASTGVLSSSSGSTDGAGQAVFTFSSGSDDKSNRIATITATSNAKTAQTQIRIVGGTLVLDTSGASTLLVGGGAVNLTATVRDAAGTPVVGTAVTFASSDVTKATLGAASAVTNGSGIVTVSLTGVAAGTVTINASANGISASKALTVVSSGSSFYFSSPLNNSVISTGTTQAIVVAAPGVANVTFATTLGLFSNGLNAQVVPVVSGVATANYSSAGAGLATINAYDATNTAKTVNLPLIVSPPVSSANKILLNGASNVQVSGVGGSLNGVTITARAIRNSGAVDEGVYNVPILFTLSGGPGAGEFLDRAIGFTDSSGNISTTFYSGSVISTLNGIRVHAAILGTAVGTGVAPSNADLLITIGGQALSVALGQGISVASSSDDTYYELPFSAQVTDATGAAVSGATVSLSLRPYAFSPGTFACAQPALTFCTEDTNGNGSLDAGEDGYRVQLPSDLSVTSCTGTTTIGSLNNLLTPPNSSAGSVPSTIVTGVTGIAPFKLTYLKNSAVWVVVKLTATVNSAGTESSSSTIFRLRPSVIDATLVSGACILPASPYTN